MWGKAFQDVTEACTLNKNIKLLKVEWRRGGKWCGWSQNSWDFLVDFASYLPEKEPGNLLKMLISESYSTPIALESLMVNLTHDRFGKSESREWESINYNYNLPQLHTRITWSIFDTCGPLASLQGFLTESLRVGPKVEIFRIDLDLHPGLETSKPKVINKQCLLSNYNFSENLLSNLGTLFHLIPTILS